MIPPQISTPSGPRNVKILFGSTARMVTAAIGIFTAILTQPCGVTAEDAVRPNVLLIMTDDQGWGDIASHGNPIVSTPTLDRLADQGVRLDRFYVSPVCAPTRAALLTGRYPERSGVSGVSNRHEMVRSDETTIAEVFRDAGYQTGCFGKWHNGAQMPLHPNGQGFDEFFGFCGGVINLYDDALLEHNGTPVQTAGYITDVITDAAIDFLERSEDEPFFCYVPYNAPHSPFQVHQDLFDKYNNGEIPEKTAAVYAMVENIDDNVRRLLDALARLELDRNTIVVFLTDNGPNGQRFNGGMRGAKASVHEGGCRVPAFIRWPERIRPSRTSQIAAHIDLLPTLAEWCGIVLPDSLALDGKSLVRLIEQGSDKELEDRSILTYRPVQFRLDRFGNAAVRTNQYRLTIERGKTALFDMQNDPGQKSDVSDRLPAVTAKLKAEIEAYVDSIRDSITPIPPLPIAKVRPAFLPAIDAVLSGNPTFADGIVWSQSWVDHWESPDDQIAWPVRFLEPGRYHIALHYVCDSANTSVTATIDEHELSARLQRFPSQARVRPELDSEAAPRRIQSFHVQSLGVFDAKGGTTNIRLQRGDESDAMIELGGITVTSVDVPEKQDLHLFVLAGQSNMAGRGTVTPVDQHPDPRILMLDREGRWVPATDPLHFDKSIAGVGLGSEFARRYLARHPGVTVGLVPCAVGGSAIASWQPGGFHDQTRSHPFDDAEQRIKIAGRNGTFHGILWHQGESDCKPDLAERYKGDLELLFTRFRDLTGDATPILIGGLARHQFDQWNAARKQIDRAHRELAEEISGSAFIDPSGLSVKSDNVHFDRTSLIEFGRRYADALAKVNEEP